MWRMLSYSTAGHASLVVLLLLLTLAPRLWDTSARPEAVRVRFASMSASAVKEAPPAPIIAPSRSGPPPTIKSPAAQKTSPPPRYDNAGAPKAKQTVVNTPKKEVSTLHQDASLKTEPAPDPVSIETPSTPETPSAPASTPEPPVLNPIPVEAPPSPSPVSRETPSEKSPERAPAIQDVPDSPERSSQNAGAAVESEGIDKDALERYAIGVRAAIQKNFAAGYFKTDVECRISFTVLRNGAIIDPKVDISSSFPHIDGLAVEAVKKTKLPPFPESLQKESLRLAITFDFNQ